MRFSIVVPLHRVTPSVHRLLGALGELDYEDFEVLVVSDAPVDLPAAPGMELITTGASGDTSPAEKRDFAQDHATGDILAYIDDDAYPAPDWLKVAADLFSDPAIGAIGGPGVTPPGSPFDQRVGGAVYESVVGSGPLLYRFTPRTPRTVDDYPAFNLMVRKEAVVKVGGWASTFYGGEDTVFCRRLADAGILVHYDPRLIVFHHRRGIFASHMRQVHNVGRHRGNFLRTGDPSSRQAVFLVGPLAVVVALGALAISVLGRSRRRRLVAVASVMATSAACPDRSPLVRLVFPTALLAHHIAYAWGFIRGLFTPELER